MKEMRYLTGVSTLSYDEKKCAGCGQCVLVCPHGVFELEGEKASVEDRDGCMECGACTTNCPTGAIGVNPGVGCAAYILKTWLRRESAECC